MKKKEDLEATHLYDGTVGVTCNVLASATDFFEPMVTLGFSLGK